MHAKSRFPLLIPLTALLGCGVNPTPSAPASNYLNLNGDWQIVASYTYPPQLLVSSFGGTLQSTGGTVTGALEPMAEKVISSGPAGPYVCTPLLQASQVTGTLDVANNLTLAFPIGGGTAAFTATLNSNLQTFSNGTYQIAGGSCAMPATPMTISQIAPVTGTYTGTFSALDSTGVLIPGTTTTVSALVAQSTTANADGQFPITGTITTTGNCSITFSLVDAYIIGGDVVQSPGGTQLPSDVVVLVANPTATMLAGSFFSLSACNGQPYQGVLTRQ